MLTLILSIFRFLSIFSPFFSSSSSISIIFFGFPLFSIMELNGDLFLFSSKGFWVKKSLISLTGEGETLFIMGFCFLKSEFP